MHTREMPGIHDKMNESHLFFYILWCNCYVTWVSCIRIEADGLSVTHYNLEEEGSRRHKTSHELCDTNHEMVSIKVSRKDARSY